MRKFLKGLLIVVVFAVICLISYTAKYYLDGKKQIEVSANNNQEDKTSVNQTKVDNENKEDETNKNKEEEEIELDNKEDDDKEVNEEVNLNDDEKAIELAKKQYGTVEGVYFRIEQMQSNNVYIVSVRDSETTRDLAWYTVDVKNGTVK